jgi:hypothetical protein
MHEFISIGLGHFVDTRHARHILEAYYAKKLSTKYRLVKFERLFGVSVKVEIGVN